MRQMMIPLAWHWGYTAYTVLSTLSDTATFLARSDFTSCLRLWVKNGAHGSAASTRFLSHDFETFFCKLLGRFVTGLPVFLIVMLHPTKRPVWRWMAASGLCLFTDAAIQSHNGPTVLEFEEDGSEDELLCAWGEEGFDRWPPTQKDLCSCVTTVHAPRWRDFELN